MMRRNVCPPLVGNPVAAIVLAVLVLLGGFVPPDTVGPTATAQADDVTSGIFSKTGSLAVNRDRADAKPTPPTAPRVIREGDSSLKRVSRPVDHPADGCLTAWRLPAPRLVRIFNHTSAPVPRVVHRRIRHALVLRGPPSIA